MIGERLYVFVWISEYKIKLKIAETLCNNLLHGRIPVHFHNSI